MTYNWHPNLLETLLTVCPHRLAAVMLQKLAVAQIKAFHYLADLPSFILSFVAYLFSMIFHFNANKIDTYYPISLPRRSFRYSLITNSVCSWCCIMCLKTTRTSKTFTWAISLVLLHVSVTGWLKKRQWQFDVFMSVRCKHDTCMKWRSGSSGLVASCIKGVYLDVIVISTSVNRHPSKYSSKGNKVGLASRSNQRVRLPMKKMQSVLCTWTLGAVDCVCFMPSFALQVIPCRCKLHMAHAHRTQTWKVFARCI